MKEENKFMPLAKDIADLVEQKDKAYGSAFEITGKLIAILYPNGVQPSQYGSLLAITRILDKIVRIANNDGEDPMNENPFMDILGYSLLASFYDLSGGGRVESKDEDLPKNI